MRRLGTLLGALMAIVAATAGCGGGDSGHPGHSIPQGQRYVAIGDSYSAGAGIPTTEHVTGCVRSDHDYPTLFARAVGARLTDVTCSGATTQDVSQQQQTTAGPLVAPQEDAVDAQTDLVTVGLGLNDLGFFADPMIGCLTGVVSPPAGGCSALGSARADGLEDRLPAVGAALTSALGVIRQRAPHATVLLIGYPQPFPASGSCPEWALTATEYVDFRGLFVALGETLHAAADRAGATYVDVTKASAGHDVCAKAPWLNGPVTNAQGVAYHPLAAEEAAVALLVEAALRK